MIGHPGARWSEQFDAPRQEPPVRLSALEFDVLTDRLSLGPVPLVLKVASPGRTHGERAELVESAWQALAARGLVRGDGTDERLLWMLRLLCRPGHEIDGRLWLGRSVRLLAAGGEERAVLAVKDGDALTLSPAAPSGLPREAASVPPASSPGPGRSVSLRSTDLDAAAAEAGDDTTALRAALVRRGVRTDDAEALVAMVGEVGARGQFGAAVTDRRGRHRADRVVGFFDTPHGRYLQSRRASPSGEQWSTVAPLDTRRLITHLDELLTAVVRGSGRHGDHDHSRPR